VAALPADSLAEGAATIGGFSRVMSERLGGNLYPGAEADWQTYMGFQPLDVQSFLLFSAPPTHGMMLRLASGAVADVAPTLLATGYREKTQDGVTALARGEDDAWKEGDGSAGDIFGGRGNWSARVALDGDLILSATSWPTLLATAGTAPQGHPHLPALARALDDPAWGDAQFIQAQLWPDPDNLPGADSGEGLPPWGLTLMADLAQGQDTLTLLLFTYDDRAQAESVIDRIGRAWDEPGLVLPPLRELAGGPMEAQVLGDGPYVAAVAVRGPVAFRNGWPYNSAFQAFHDDGHVLANLRRYGPT
jgi:hypothetical protein